MLLSFSTFGKENVSLCKIENNKVISQNICKGFITIGEQFTYEGEFRNGRIEGNGKFEPYGKVKTKEDNHNYKVLKDKKHFGETK